MNQPSRKSGRFQLQDADCTRITRGILSNKPQRRFGDALPTTWFAMPQCNERDLTTTTTTTNRRVFYGRLIANVPIEVLDIVAKETYGIFAGLFFVE